ncbi:E3 ubiquitin-protein ligase RNF8 [Ascaphus truei]|uniref:E3 ubiquitin-protein ligase RNF8 n=1 Tax=Ascaphus truei TaxID=8439 RepID=UPI003F5A6D6D
MSSADIVGFSVKIAVGFSVKIAVGFSVKIAVGFSVKIASLNGVWLDKERLDPGKAHVLSAGSCIQLGVPLPDTEQAELEYELLQEDRERVRPFLSRPLSGTTKEPTKSSHRTDQAWEGSIFATYRRQKRQSLNGVWLDKERLDPGKAHVLSAGSCIQLGVPLPDTEQAELEYKLLQEDRERVRPFLSRPLSGKTKGPRTKLKLNSEDSEASGTEGPSNSSKAKVHRVARDCEEPTKSSHRTDQAWEGSIFATYRRQKRQSLNGVWLDKERLDPGKAHVLSAGSCIQLGVPLPDTEQAELEYKLLQEDRERVRPFLSRPLSGKTKGPRTKWKLNSEDSEASGTEGPSNSSKAKVHRVARDCEEPTKSSHRTDQAWEGSIFATYRRQKRQSLNGVWLDKERLDPGKAHVLSAGSCIQLGVPLPDTEQAELEYELLQEDRERVRPFLSRPLSGKTKGPRTKWKLNSEDSEASGTEGPSNSSKAKDHRVARDCEEPTKSSHRTDQAWEGSIFATYRRQKRQSLNGVWLDKERLDPGKAHVLSAGSCIQLGVPLPDTEQAELEYELLQEDRERVHPFLSRPLSGKTKGPRTKLKLNSEDSEASGTEGPSNSSKAKVHCVARDCEEPTKSSHRTDQAWEGSIFATFRRQKRQEEQEKVRAQKEGQNHMNDLLKNELQCTTCSEHLIEEEQEKVRAQKEEVLNHMNDVLDNELKCAICSEHFIEEEQEKVRAQKEEVLNHMNDVLDNELKCTICSEHLIEEEQEKVRAQKEEVLNHMNDVLDNELKCTICSEHLIKEEQEKVRAQKEEVLNHMNDVLDNELKCTICSEHLIEAVTLNCAHSFCSYCIQVWKKRKEKCPMCRQEIRSQTRSLVLDNCIDSMVNKLSPEMKARRESLIVERKDMRQAEEVIPVTSDSDSISFPLEVVFIPSGSFHFGMEYGERRLLSGV